MSENMPYITFDIGLGKYVDDIDVNYDSLSQYMEQRGFSEAEIADTMIHVSSDELAPKGRRDGHTFITGRYLRYEDRIVLYPVAATKEFTGAKAHILELIEGPLDDVTPELLGEIDKQLDSDNSRRASQTLARQVEHRKVYLKGGMPEMARYLSHENRKAMGKTALVSLGIWGGFVGVQELSGVHINGPVAPVAAGIAIAGCSAFLVHRRNQRPGYPKGSEEARRRSTPESAPPDLITIRSKGSLTGE